MSKPQLQNIDDKDKNPERSVDRFSDAPPQWKKLGEIMAMRSSTGEPAPSGFGPRPPTIVGSPHFSGVATRQPVPVKGDGAGVYTPKPFQQSLPAPQGREPSCDISVVGSGVSQQPQMAEPSRVPQVQHAFQRPTVHPPGPSQTYSFASPPHLAQDIRYSAPCQRPPQPRAPPSQLPHIQQPPPPLHKRNQRSSSSHIIESITQLVNQSQNCQNVHQKQQQCRQPPQTSSANPPNCCYRGDTDIRGLNAGNGSKSCDSPSYSQVWTREGSKERPPPPPPPSASSLSIHGKTSPVKNLTEGDQDDLRRLHELMEISRAETEICQMEMVMQNQEAEAIEQRKLARERAFQETERSLVANNGHVTRHTESCTDVELTNEIKDESVDELDRLRRGNKYWSTGLVSGGPSDRELISLLLTRLTQLESQLTRSKDVISERDRVIDELKKKISISGKASPATVPPVSTKKRVQSDAGKDDLQKECRRLQKHVREMEKFLADYGLEWVGAGSGASSDDLTTARSHADAVEGDGDKPDALRSPTTSPRGGDAAVFSVNFDLLTSRVVELNLLAGADQQQLCRTPRGARFMVIPPLPLAVYSNGILLENGPFRPYSDPLVQLLVMDLQDGYFPTELKERFPDGVPLKLMDRRHEKYRPPSPKRTFSGPGYRLGGRRRNSRLISEHYGRLQKEREQQQQLEEQRRQRAGSIDSTGQGGGGLMSARYSSAKSASARRTPSSSGYLSAASSAGSRGSSAGHDQERTRPEHGNEKGRATEYGRPGHRISSGGSERSQRSRNDCAGVSSGCDRSTSPLPPRCKPDLRPSAAAPLSPLPPPLSPPQSPRQAPQSRISASTVELSVASAGEAGKKGAGGSGSGGSSFTPLPGAGGQSQAVSRFLARLPKTVVRNGRLIEIRRSVEELLSGRVSPSSASVPVVAPAAPPPAEPAPSVSKTAQTEAPSPPAQPPLPTTVRVRTPQDACLTLQLTAASTVAELRQCIDANIHTRNTEPYGLMTAYPRRMLWNSQLTLHECGLSPNGVVVMTRQRSM